MLVKQRGKIIHNHPQIFFSIFKTILQHLCRLCYCSLGVYWHSTEVGLGLVLWPTKHAHLTHITCEQGLHFCLQDLARPLVLLLRENMPQGMLLLCLGPRLEKGMPVET